MINSLMLPVFCYALPKIGAYLTTKPSADLPARNALEKLRADFSRLYENKVRKIGERRWDAFLGIVVDNVWISVLCLTLSSNAIPLTLITGVRIIFGAICFHTVRYYLAGIPFLNHWIAPRRLYANDFPIPYGKLYKFRDDTGQFLSIFFVRKGANQ